MDNSEFSNTFDVLYNNITSNQAPGLNEYEKSVFLTKAQNEIVKAYFNPRLNKTQEGFDGNEKRQIDFSMIMRTNSFTNFGLASFDNKDNTRSVILPSDVMMFVNEFADVTRGNKSVRLVVVPIDYKEYSRLSNKPYKRPTQYQAWRLINNINSVNQSEIIIGAGDVLTKYSIRYIKKPYPIIIGDLDDLSIDGYNKTYSDYYKLDTWVCTQDTIVIEEDYITNTNSMYHEFEDSNSNKIGFGYYFNKTDKKVYKVFSDTYIENPQTFTSKIKFERITFGPIYDFIKDNYFDKDVELGAKFHKIKSSTQACELDPILHEEILQRAVELAKASWEGSLNSQIALGQNSETNMGVIPQARQ